MEQLILLTYMLLPVLVGEMITHRLLFTSYLQFKLVDPLEILVLMFRDIRKKVGNVNAEWKKSLKPNPPSS